MLVEVEIVEIHSFKFPGSEFSSLDSEAETLQLASTITRPSLVPSSLTRPTRRPIGPFGSKLFEGCALGLFHLKPNKKFMHIED